MKKYSALKKIGAAVVSVCMAFGILTGCGADKETTDSGWSYGQVEIGGGGFVTGVFSTCEENVYYARTDVGGAYRWDEAEQHWKSLGYWVTDDDKGLLGIDGLAVDPNDASKLYLLAGTEYFSGGKTAVLVSDDYGETFDVVDVTDKIKAHGNGMGRGNGERIAVDPNNGSIIFVGGRTGGMLKSIDSGKTWEQVASFPVTSTANSNGINGILFDPSSEKDGASQRIYASVSRNGDDNIFVSEDGGASWEPLKNGNTKLMPQRMKLNSKGDLYVAYATKEGPWNAGAGALYRYNAADGSAEDISPLDVSFGDVVIDPTDDNKLVAVSTNNWNEQPNGSFGDTFYVSTDGGKNWTNIIKSMTMSDGGIPWIENYAIHWCCSLEINPFNTNEIMVTSGNGIFACDNIWDEHPGFYFNARGIEEVVPEDIITMEGYPLISAIGDYDGFVHEDIHTPAQRHKGQIGSCTSIAIAYQNRDYWAKVGGSESEMALIYSTDGGEIWTNITNSPEEGKILYRGKLAFNADGSRLFWSSSNSIHSYYTDDFGKTWTKCDGISGSDIYFLGDPNNSNYVYACGKSVVFLSSDGGKTFSRMQIVSPSFSRLCADPSEEGTFYIPAGAGLFKATDHGENSVLVDGIKYCEAVGLGKAKNEGDPYVIYIYGTPKDSDVKGVYMSEDNGATWVRVNDDLHNFGGTGNGVFISGDMNVYGRCYMSTVGLGIAYFDKNEK
ncbi:MAG: WD40/YVTN/BNR-like repeat-containing protein [Oscillospiraceae bacterium]